MQFNIPTLLTLFRVILIPFFVVVFYLPFRLGADGQRADFLYCRDYRLV
ncbi:phosphotidylglycerophosphate synthetase [Salmonella enterica subsp. enterica]|uniref:Phosphotidylglycerophosphate synthetase n=1 Tax=Salmonella enterica I TaxID=59201 RepID=A0A447PLQ4_SALET|nr:phosphotidylglycerophosphate synthetase [Salmonella enterica subsp. enterica]